MLENLQACFLWKSAIFHPLKLPFDAEAAEKFLKVIYYISMDYTYDLDRKFEITLELSGSQNIATALAWLQRLVYFVLAKISMAMD